MISQKIPNEERNSQSMSRVLEETSSKAHQDEVTRHINMSHQQKSYQSSNSSSLLAVTHIHQPVDAGARDFGGGNGGF